MKPFAIYFPQFYPTKTNDDAWGAGFTDWALVANANLRDAWPRRAPATGFYDGASAQVHARQMAEAAHAGIGGLGVYHYWFYSHQELNAFEQTLLRATGSASSRQVLPWFLIWASEGWSKRWLANPDILIHLSSAPNRSAIERHCDHLATCFAHPMYARWRGKPLFVWYNLGHFDEPEAVVVEYREALRRRGIDVAVAHFIKNPFDLEFCRFTDASYVFEPRLFFGSRSLSSGSKSKAALNAMRRIIGSHATESLLVVRDRLQKSGNTHLAKDFLSYMASPERAALLESATNVRQEVISPGWDNTPRYGNRFTALQPLEPSDFEGLIRKAMDHEDLPPLLNAWNEWAEGAAIEPCAYLGRRYLDAVSRAAFAASAVSQPPLCTPATS